MCKLPLRKSISDRMIIDIIFCALLLLNELRYLYIMWELIMKKLGILPVISVTHFIIVPLFMVTSHCEELALYQLFTLYKALMSNGVLPQ